MTAIVIGALVIGLIVLWQRVTELRQRLDAVEAHSFAKPESTVVPPMGAPAAPQPVPTPRPARVVTSRPPEPMPTEPAAPTLEPSPAAVRSFRFEDVFGRRLPIWAGGVTLAVSGVLIVRYSIETGLLSPLIRVLAGLLFGAGLLAGAEVARHQAERVRDPRVPQALAGASVATLYAATLIATDLYGLIGPWTGFIGLAFVTALAGLLSLRFGPASALLGLLGGLAAPALVGSGTPDVPLLSAYLALAIGGLATLGRAKRWPWLGVLAIAGGFGWGGIMLLAGALDATATAALGLYLLLMGVALPALALGRGAAALRWAGTLAAAIELGAMMTQSGFRPLDWGLYALLSVASVWLSRRDVRLADLPAPALGIALVLTLAWPHPTTAWLAAVLAGAGLIHGSPALQRLWRVDGRLSDAAGMAMLAAALWFVPWLQLPLAHGVTASLALAGAGVALSAAALGWRAARVEGDERLSILLVTGATLGGISAWFALPDWAVPPAVAAIGAVLLLVAPAMRDRQVERIAALVAGVAALLAIGLDGDPALARAAGSAGHRLSITAAFGWAVPAVAAALFAWRGRVARVPTTGAVGAMLLGYVAAAQVVPTPWLPLLPALALAVTLRSRTATATAGLLAAGWAAAPLGQWLAAGAAAIGGEPLFVTALPALLAVATRLLAPALALAWLLRRDPPARTDARRAVLATAVLLATVAAHIAYKHLFAISDLADFVQLGVAERTLWEGLLALGAVATCRRAPRVAAACAIAALAHVGWFTLALHDPLWARQAVGAWPVVNWLLPAYAIPLALLWAAGHSSLPAPVERARQNAPILLIALLTLSELRQLAHGSLLALGPVGPAEDITRSLAAVALGVGFLLWGIRTHRRDWRIASLLLMLGAAVKVFVFDASGLDGLLRIGSFAALGFSLIGIGWLYSRYLPEAGPVDPAPAQA